MRSSVEPRLGGGTRARLRPPFLATLAMVLAAIFVVVGLGVGLGLYLLGVL